MPEIHKRCGERFGSWAHIDQCGQSLPPYALCVVRNCGVWSRYLDKHGMCPRSLWDVKHEVYAAKLRQSA